MENSSTLLGKRTPPKQWDEWSEAEKLDWIAERILAEDRYGTTAHGEMKESGILSRAQYERRLKREVYTYQQLRDTSWQSFYEGVFSRTHSKLVAKINKWQDPLKETKDEWELEELEGREYPVGFWYSGGN